jgi:hypothetical protein
LIEKINRMAPLTRGYLEDTRPVGVEGDKVILGIDREFESNRERLEIPRNLQAIRKALSDNLHRPVNVVWRVVDNLRELAVPEAPAAAENEAPEDAGISHATSEDPREKALADPAVQHVLEAFDGTIVDIR